MTELHTKAVRIHLLWGYWNPEKTDKDITDTTNKSLGVKNMRGHYDKALFSEEYMKPLRQHTSKIKQYYYSHTLPWEDRVSRLISAKSVEDVARVLNKAVMDYEDILRAVVMDYDQAVMDQQIWLGTSWRRGDYPNRDKFMEKYHAALRIMPLTTTTDLRCELSTELRAQVEESIKKDTEERFAIAVADCWQRLYDPVKAMAERLGNKDAVFKDTLVRNVLDVCRVLPELNILDNPLLTRMTDEVMAKLNVDPQVLRDSDVERAKYAQRADELADMLSRMGVN